MKRISTLLLVAALGTLSIAGLSPAEASCSRTREFTSLRSFASYSYIQTPGVCIPDGGLFPCAASRSQTSVTSDFTGVFWALGFGDPDLGQGIDNGFRAFLNGISAENPPVPGFPAIQGTCSGSPERLCTTGRDCPGGGTCNLATTAQSGWVRFYPGAPAYVQSDWSASSRIDGCIDDLGRCQDGSTACRTEQDCAASGGGPCEYGVCADGTSCGAAAECGICQNGITPCVTNADCAGLGGTPQCRADCRVGTCGIDAGPCLLDLTCNQCRARCADGRRCSTGADCAGIGSGDCSQRCNTGVSCSGTCAGANATDACRLGSGFCSDGTTQCFTDLDCEGIGTGACLDITPTCSDDSTLCFSSDDCADIGTGVCTAPVPSDDCMAMLLSDQVTMGTCVGDPSTRCTIDAHCGDCVPLSAEDRTCQDGTTPCVRDVDCSGIGDGTCIVGTCDGDGTSFCQGDGDCGQCLLGVCQGAVQCSDDSDCPNSVCGQKFCIDAMTPCDNDADCAALGGACQGECGGAIPCATRRDCPVDGTACRTGRCAGGQLCTSDLDCVISGQPIGDGICRQRTLTSTGYFAGLSSRLSDGFSFVRPSNAPLDLAEVPQPVVSASTAIDLVEVTIDPVAQPTLYLGGAPCDTGVATGYKIYRRIRPPNLAQPIDLLRVDRFETGSSLNQPNPRTGWEVATGGSAAGGGPLPFGSPATVFAPCARLCWDNQTICTANNQCPPFPPGVTGQQCRARGPKDVWLATSIVFDGGFETEFLSAPVGPFRCTPAGSPSACTPDADNDGYCPDPAGGDCNDAQASVFPGAIEACNDNLNNDCLHPSWPTVFNQLDDDLDGFTECQGDCNDAPGGAAIYPTRPEVCDGIDNDCDTIVDESPATGQADSDLDGVAGACDNCPTSANASQIDSDGDGSGDACDNCPTVAGSATDTDGDGKGDVCDNCPTISNSALSDVDLDGFGDACDNCPDTFNDTQLDTDGDLLGNACDSCPNAENVFAGELGVCNSETTNLSPILVGCRASGDCNNSTNSTLRPCRRGVCQNGLNRCDADADCFGIQDGACLSGVCDDGTTFCWRSVDCLGIGSSSCNFNQSVAPGAVPDNVGICSDGTTPCRTYINCPSGRCWVGFCADEVTPCLADRVSTGANPISDCTTSSPARCIVRQADTDGDSVGNPCDNCRVDYNPEQFEFGEVQVGNNRDLVGDACDNCISEDNFDQADTDADGIGDACDAADGLIFLRLPDAGTVLWQAEAGFDSWNLYRGDVAVLRATGAYVQQPGSNPVASVECSLAEPVRYDDVTVEPGHVVFFLASGNVGGVEVGLGEGPGGPPPPQGACP